MGYLLTIAIACGLLYLLFRKKGNTHINSTSGPKGASNGTGAKEAEEHVPRDFLGLQYNYLNTPKPLREMLKENEPAVMKELVEFLNNGGTYERKHAAFALGQIGDENYIEQLEYRQTHEQVKGVAEAIDAALVALRQAPSGRGFTEMDRRRIIEDVYRRG